MRPGRRVPAVRLLPAILLSAITLPACGDGTPSFCGPLASMADLEALSQALEDDDLSGARAEAQRLSALSEEAPSEIRADFAALSDAVVDIVELLEADDSHAGGDEADEGGSSDGSGPAEVERRREELNTRLGELDRRSIRVATWAARECGLDLT